MIGTKIRLTIAAGTLALLAGCASTPVEKKNFAEFRKANPRSILVVPVVNRSVDVNAPDYFLSTITNPIAERGYYVFPINLVKHVMEDDGLADANLVHSSDPTRLASLFGADSVLYISIERWDAKYIVLKTITTVELSYSLKSGLTGEELWKHQEKMVYDPAAQHSNGGIGGLVAMAVISAIEKAKPNYLPLARQANVVAVYRPGQGIPAGPKDLQYQKDLEQF